MNTAGLVKQWIRFVYSLSPYFWLDNYFKQQEFAFEAESQEWQAVRNKRLFLSEFYIVGWLVLSFLITILTVFYDLPEWLIVLFLLRIFGILNKELGVILFGTCKITEGGMVSATGRVIVLAMVNFATAMFLFASSYQIKGTFIDVPAYFMGDWPVAGIIQAFHIQFTMSGAFTPADSFSWLLTTSQGMFGFIFGTIVISLFVSLLNVKPLRA